MDLAERVETPETRVRLTGWRADFSQDLSMRRVVLGPLSGKDTEWLLRSLTSPDRENEGEKETTGAPKDMIQSYPLQLLALAAMRHTGEGHTGRRSKSGSPVRVQERGSGCAERRTASRPAPPAAEDVTGSPPV